MEITLPQGCNVYYGTYIDNYNGYTRTRYYINEGELVANNSQSYNYNPTPSGAVCTDTISYHTEYSVYFECISIIVVLFAFWLLYKTIIKRLLP